MLTTPPEIQTQWRRESDEQQCEMGEQDNEPTHDGYLLCLDVNVFMRTLPEVCLTYMR